MGEVLRIKKHSNNYVILDKTFLEDDGLTWKAKGILTYLLSRPDGWEVRVSDLVKHSQDGKTAVYSALKELKEAGYYQKVPVRDEKYRIIRWESTISELPMTDQENADSESENDCKENAKRCTKSKNKATTTKKTVQKSKTETANSQETKVEQADAELNSSILESNLSKTELKLDEAELELDVPYSENLKVGEVKIGNRERNKELNILKNDNSNINKYCASDDAPSSFEHFFETVWNLYPRKRGKAKVSNQQKKHLCEIGQELLRALERYKDELKVESWKQPQNGDTFFTRGYVDYLDDNYVPVEPKTPSPKTPSTSKKNSFTNFTQRSYDFDELERLLLTTPCPS